MKAQATADFARWGTRAGQWDEWRIEKAATEARQAVARKRWRDRKARSRAEKRQERMARGDQGAGAGRPLMVGGQEERWFRMKLLVQTWREVKKAVAKRPGRWPTVGAFVEAALEVALEVECYEAAGEGTE